MNWRNKWRISGGTLGSENPGEGRFPPLRPPKGPLKWRKTHRSEAAGCFLSGGESGGSGGMKVWGTSRGRHVEGLGRGKWAMLGVPHKGWSCVGYEDLGELGHVCEMCESQEVRFIHYMEHPEYSGTLGVGCVCAGHMEQNRSAAGKREAELKSTAAKRRRWAAKTWKTSQAGNPYLKVDGFHVVIYERVRGRGAWALTITKTKSGQSFPGQKSYASMEHAKMAAFNGLVWLRAKR